MADLRNSLIDQPNAAGGGAAATLSGPPLASPWPGLWALLRAHHWPKNLLVFVPMLLVHDFSAPIVLAAAGAFVAFCLAASAAYIVNDFRDIAADRLHPHKRRRPLAAGTVRPAHALALAPVLLALAAAIAWFLPTGFAIALGMYVAATVAYTLVVKRMLGADVVALGCLYCLRVIAGDRAVGSDPSEWILGFSLFFFLSLALVKRFTELSYLARAGGGRAPNRAYRTEDLPIMIAMAAAAGLGAIMIFARYLGSPDVDEHWSKPERLWYVAPILVYWQLRLMLLANRLRIEDDPVIFATRDPKSLLCAVAIAAIMLWAV